jgi:hypothetical protein
LDWYEAVGDGLFCTQPPASVTSPFEGLLSAYPSLHFDLISMWAQVALPSVNDWVPVNGPGRFRLVFSAKLVVSNGALGLVLPGGVPVPCLAWTDFHWICVEL